MAKTILGLVGETNINRPNPETAFHQVQPLLDKADVLFGHMETTVAEVTTENRRDLESEGVKDDLPYKRGWKHSKTECLNAWKAAGFDAVGCASNCSGDANAILLQLKALDAIGLPHAGIGMNIAEARKPAIVEKNGVKFGFLSYTSVFWPQFVPALAYKPGAATAKALMSIVPSPRAVEMPGAMPAVMTWLDEKEKTLVLEDIAKLRPQVDHTVLSCHWGCSSSTVIEDYQKELAHAAIEAGADVVMGHHPHLPQGIEVYQGKPIFYSMGNFAFDWWFCRDQLKDGYMAYVVFENGSITGASFAPVRREDGSNDAVPLSPDSEAFNSIAANIRKLSEPFRLETEIADGEVVIHL